MHLSQIDSSLLLVAYGKVKRLPRLYYKEYEFIFEVLSYSHS